jgi:hypothetical protein
MSEQDWADIQQWSGESPDMADAVAMAVANTVKPRVKRPKYLGELMKKGGLDIDAIINSRVGDYYSLDKPRDPGFANYLKDTYRWSKHEARRQWRALLDRDIDPAVILNTRRATWRKMTQNKQTKVATSEQNLVEPLSRHTLCSTSSL